MEVVTLVLTQKKVEQIENQELFLHPLKKWKSQALQSPWNLGSWVDKENHCQDQVIGTEALEPVTGKKTLKVTCKKT